MIEVECKFRAETVDALLEQIGRDFGAVFVESIEQLDEYFDHSAHDFERTDEALRIRRVLIGGVPKVAQLCYKGPRLDAHTKTRAELECELGLSGADSSLRCGLILKALGFYSQGVVEKKRDVYSFQTVGRSWHLSIDRVTGLGTYVELETLCEESDRLIATDALQELAKSLNLGPSIRESYLELLFA